MDTSHHQIAPSPVVFDRDGSSTSGAFDALLNTVQAAAYLSLSPSTLEKDRCLGRLQIPYLKLGSKRVAYDRRDLDHWKQGRRRLSTSERAT